MTPLTVRRWVNAGDLPATKPGGNKAGWRIDADDLAVFMDRRKFGATEEEMGEVAAARRADRFWTPPPAVQLRRGCRQCTEIER